MAAERATKGGRDSGDDVMLVTRMLQVSTPDRYSYVSVGDVTGCNAVVFSVAANNDAHVAIGPSDAHAGRHYEIVIGGWSNTKCVIRERNQGPPIALAHARVLGGMGEEREFWLRWGPGQDGLIQFGKGHVIGRDIMMEASMTAGMHITRMAVCTGWGSSGRWTIGKPGGAAESASGAADAGAGAGAGASAGADDKDRRHGGASSDSDVRLGLECLPVVTPDRYNYVFVLDVEEYNAVVFSVAANNDAHVALGPSKVHDGRHYEFVIGGWGNTKCVIRERKQGPPVAFADGRFLGGMAEERKFWLRWGSGPDGLLEFGRGHDVGHDVVMTARMSFGLRITSMLVCTGWGSSGRWTIGRRVNTDSDAGKAAGASDSDARSVHRVGSGGEIWECALCTFHNSIAAPRCGMCGAPQGEVAALGSDAGGAAAAADAGEPPAGEPEEEPEEKPQPEENDGDLPPPVALPARGASASRGSAGADTADPPSEHDGGAVGTVMECVVCMDSGREAVLVPCGHNAVCMACAAALSHCPICRANVAQVVRLFTV